jgi:hypothetical protein
MIFSHRQSKIQFLLSSFFSFTYLHYYCFKGIEIKTNKEVAIKIWRVKMAKYMKREACRTPITQLKNKHLYDGAYPKQCTSHLFIFCVKTILILLLSVYVSHTIPLRSYLFIQKNMSPKYTMFRFPFNH